MRHVCLRLDRMKRGRGTCIKIDMQNFAAVVAVASFEASHISLQQREENRRAGKNVERKRAIELYIRRQ